MVIFLYNIYMSKKKQKEPKGPGEKKLIRFFIFLGIGVIILGMVLSILAGFSII